MKATLIVIQNDSDHAQAKALIEKLMESKDSSDQARMVAQAYLTEAYERSRWPRRVPSLPDLLSYLMDQHGLSRSDLIPLLGTAPRKRGNDRQTRAEHDYGAQAPGEISYSRGPAHPATAVVRNRGVTDSHFGSVARSRKSPHANSNGDCRNSG